MVVRLFKTLHDDLVIDKKVYFSEIRKKSRGVRFLGIITSHKLQNTQFVLNNDKKKFLGMASIAQEESLATTAAEPVTTSTKRKRDSTTTTTTTTTTKSPKQPKAKKSKTATAGSGSKKKEKGKPTATKKSQKRKRQSQETSKNSSSQKPVAAGGKRQKRDALPLPDHPRPVLLENLEQGIEIIDETAETVWQNVERDAKKYLDTEAQKLFGNPENFPEEFLAMIEFVLGMAVRMIFRGKPHKNLTREQAVRIQEPFRLFMIDRMYTGDYDMSCENPKRSPHQIFEEIYRPSTLQTRMAEVSGEPAPTGISDSKHQKDITRIEPYFGKHNEGLDNLVAQTLLWAIKQYPANNTAHNNNNNDNSQASGTGSEGEMIDPRIPIIRLAPLTCERISYYVYPIRLDASDTTGKNYPIDTRGRPARCCMTGRLLKTGDLVRTFRMRFRRVFTAEEAKLPENQPPMPAAAPSGQRFSNENGAGDTDQSAVGSEPIVIDPETGAGYQIHVRTAALDHALFSERQAEMGITPVSKSRLYVSSIGIRILMFASIQHWLRSEILPFIHESVASEEAIKSYETLEKQRRRTGHGGSSTALVAKKNKPDKLEERIMAWRDFSYSPAGVRRLVELYGRFKNMQFDYLKSFKQLQSIVVPIPSKHSTPDVEAVSVEN